MNVKKPDPLAKNREVAKDHVRSRRDDVAAPPIIRSKRNRSANQEDRWADQFGRRRRLKR
jgi:hypothetical protein